MKCGLDPEFGVRLGVDGTLAALATRDTTFQDCIGKLLAGRGQVGLSELPLYPFGGCEAFAYLFYHIYNR